MTYWFHSYASGCRSAGTLMLLCCGVYGLAGGNRFLRRLLARVDATDLLVSELGVKDRTLK